MKLGDEASKGLKLYSHLSCCFSIYVSLHYINKTIHVQALLNPRAFAYFLDNFFVQKHGFLRLQKSIPMPIGVIDVHPLALVNITHEIVLWS